VPIEEWREKHDWLTIVAIAAVAFVTADLSHEGLGHGIAAYLVGARRIVLSYTYLSSDIQSRMISVAGPAVNLLEGFAALFCLRRWRMGSTATLFTFLLVMFNLLDAAAYLVYSGVLNSGDLAVVIAGIQQSQIIRLGMDLGGLVLYGAFVFLGARELPFFQAPHAPMTNISYVTPIAINTAAALLNPLGLKYFLISALPATLGANAGLLAMPRLAVRNAARGGTLAIRRSYAWICVGLVTTALFVFVVGPGIAFKP